MSNNDCTSADLAVLAKALLELADKVLVDRCSYSETLPDGVSEGFALSNERELKRIAAEERGV